MIVHAYSAYLALPDEKGRPAVEETTDYWYWPDTNPEAEALAAAGFDKYVGTADLAVAQYRIEVPADVVAAIEANVPNALHEFMDDLEWELDWADAPVVRRNDLDLKLTIASAERAVEHAAMVSAQRLTGQAA